MCSGSFKSQTHHVSLTGAESAEEILSIQLESLRQAHNTVNEVRLARSGVLQVQQSSFFRAADALRVQLCPSIYHNTGHVSY